MKLLVLDVDGVLLPKHTLFLDSNSNPSPFDCKDEKAMSKILQHPIPILILSGGNSPLVRRHLMRLGITAIRQSVAHKLSVLQDELLAFPELDWTDIAYVGDAENDMECLQRVGYPICPSDADEQVQALARYICSRSGGHGAVAEAIDWMLQKG